MKVTNLKHRLRARKKAFFVFLYSLFSKLSFAHELKFMNHGYAPEKGNPAFLDLGEDMEKFRYPVQLYHHLAAQVNWKGKKAVEISSGNGGGSEYIYRKFEPGSLIGVDLAPGCVKLSNKLYARDGLSFLKGDALDLPFEAGSVDIVINVESSLNYPDQEKFIEEVDRILRPGSYFIYADYFRSSRLSRVEKALSQSSLKVKTRSNISKNIIRSLELSEPDKKLLLKKHIPFFLRSVFSQFIFSGQYYEEERHRFETGEKTYISFLFQKK